MYTTISQQFERAALDRDALKEELDIKVNEINNATERLTITNKARNKVQIDLKFAENKLSEYENNLILKDKSMEGLKDEIDRLNTTIVYLIQEK